jgi:hypothetical protein
MTLNKTMRKPVENVMLRYWNSHYRNIWCSQRYVLAGCCVHWPRLDNILPHAMLYGKCQSASRKTRWKHWCSWHCRKYEDNTPQHIELCVIQLDLPKTQLQFIVGQQHFVSIQRETSIPPQPHCPKLRSQSWCLSLPLKWTRLLCTGTTHNLSHTQTHTHHTGG